MSPNPSSSQDCKLARRRFGHRAEARHGALALAVTILGLALCGTALHAKEEAPEVLRTHGLTIAMGGHPLGTMVGRDLKTKDGFVFERTQDLTIKRGDTTLTIHIETKSEVDHKLNPVRSWFLKEDASGRMVMTSKVEKGALVVDINQSGSTVTKRFPLTPGLTYYPALEHEVRENLRDGFFVERSVFVDEMSGVFPMTAKVTTKNAKASGGAFNVAIGMANLMSEETLDANGRVLRSKTPAVNAEAWPLGAPPPKGMKAGTGDMMTMTTWKIAPLTTTPTSVRYRVWSDEARKFAIPEDSRQRVVNRTDKFVEVVVAGKRASHGGLTADDRTRFLSATQFEALEHQGLRQTAARVTRDAKTTFEKVSLLTQFVYKHVKDHDLDRAYAPAVTTLLEAKGDCTEKSVLLSALLKTQGIPTRLVDGVVVSGNILGYHEWVEAQIDDEGFVPADPTFGEFPASVERLKLAQGTSDPEGILGFGLSASRLMGHGVKIEIVETR